MTIRDIQILAYSKPSRRLKTYLVRIGTDPFPDNFAVWDRISLTWQQRGMTRQQAQSWCTDNNLPDMTQGAQDAPQAQS